MKKTINRKVYDTEKSTDLGCKYFGDYGSPGGYEERLFAAKSGQHFLYGVGGSESKHSTPSIELLTEDQAKEWQNSM
jgi:hypothetical protein